LGDALNITAPVALARLYRRMDRMDFWPAETVAGTNQTGLSFGFADRRHTAIKRLSDLGVIVGQVWLYPTSYLEHIAEVVEEFKRPEAFRGLVVKLGRIKGMGGEFRPPTSDKPAEVVIDRWIFFSPPMFINTLWHEMYHAYEDWAVRNGEDWPQALHQTHWDYKGDPRPERIFPSLYALVNEKEFAAELARIYALYPHWLVKHRRFGNLDIAVGLLEQHVFTYSLASQESLLDRPLEIPVPRHEILAIATAVCAVLSLEPTWGSFIGVALFLAILGHVGRSREGIRSSQPLLVGANLRSLAVRMWSQKNLVKRTVWPFWVWTALNLAHAIFFSPYAAVTLWLAGLAIFYLFKRIAAQFEEFVGPEWEKGFGKWVVPNFRTLQAIAAGILIATLTFWNWSPQRQRFNDYYPWEEFVDAITGEAPKPHEKLIYTPLVSIPGQFSARGDKETSKRIDKINSIPDQSRERSDKKNPQQIYQINHRIQLTESFPRVFRSATDTGWGIIWEHWPGEQLYSGGMQLHQIKVSGTMPGRIVRIYIDLITANKSLGPYTVPQEGLSFSAKQLGVDDDIGFIEIIVEEYGYGALPQNYDHGPFPTIGLIGTSPSPDPFTRPKPAGRPTTNRIEQRAPSDKPQSELRPETSLLGTGSTPAAAPAAETPGALRSGA
jgi:hypothetical protein